MGVSTSTKPWSSSRNRRITFTTCRAGQFTDSWGEFMDRRGRPGASAPECYCGRNRTRPSELEQGGRKGLGRFEAPPIIKMPPPYPSRKVVGGARTVPTFQPGGADAARAGYLVTQAQVGSHARAAQV
eukprot:9474905-Pyramimonas_sp.AAC.2